MSKLARATQKIFASSAGSAQIAEFGSLAASAPQTYSGSTITPTLVQTLSNYLTGWFGAIIGANSPAIEDMNALFYLVTFQLAYLFQAGVAEYDAGTTYFTGSWCQSGGIAYVSLVDNNLGNAVTNNAYWGSPTGNGEVTPITLPTSTTVLTGTTLTWPNLTVPTGDTLTVQTGAYFLGVGTLKLSGTASLVIQGTGAARII